MLQIVVIKVWGYEDMDDILQVGSTEKLSVFGNGHEA